MIHKIFYAFIVFAIFVLLDSCSFSAKTTRELLEKAKTKSYDIIVVPGVPLEHGHWSYMMKSRIYWSKFLYDRGIAKNIMYSGSAVYTPYYEGEVMAMYAEAIGIPKDHIFTETKAEHSTENIYYSNKKARKLGFTKIALASDPFQTRMLKRFIYKEVSLDIDLIPIVFDSLNAMESEMIDPVINYQNAYADHFIPLPERESFWKRFKGTRGLMIDTSAYK